AALDAWRGSLSPTDVPGVLQVHLFSRPLEAVLERLTERQRFVLAAVAWNATLHVDDAAACTRLDPTTCADVFARLAAEGVLVVEDGSARISVPWWPTTTR